jgi:threonine/homoserine/homoserine lactone efflux protein
MSPTPIASLFATLLIFAIVIIPGVATLFIIHKSIKKVWPIVERYLRERRNAK